MDMEKTNVMRILDKEHIKYQAYDYTKLNVISGRDVATALGENFNHVFKTLVTVAKSGNHYVFVLPVNKELDLKKCAKAVNEKSIAMELSKNLLALTGYIHGGCSPIGMKKQFKTIIARESQGLETIIVSGGKIGYQIEINLEDLKRIINYELKDICEE